MKRIVIFTSLILIIALAGYMCVKRQEPPKYIYAVRQNIDYQADKQTFEVWCYREFKNGTINKQYLFDFTLYLSPDKTPARITTNQCEDKNGLHN